VEKKEFRQDLFFRLNVVPVRVPPLRERAEDVPVLAEEFMRRFSRKHGVHVKGFTDESLALLKAHRWPGNVRELQNIVERAVIMCGESGMLEPEHLGLTAPAASSSASVVVNSSIDPPTETHGFPTLEELEKHHIFAALDRCKGNRTHAAKMLNVSIRTLRNKLHEYNGTSPRNDDDKDPIEA
jgi:DNA-binding NtrC family response regulator